MLLAHFILHLLIELQYLRLMDKEWTTASLAIGKEEILKLLKSCNFHIQLLYSAYILYWIKVNSGEYKLMGLAPYGKPKYAQLIKDKLVKIARMEAFILI